VRRPVTLAVVSTVLLLWSQPMAAATEVDHRQLSELAERAESDPAALEALRRVTIVDGRPVDMEAVLDVAPAALAARLESMAKLDGTGAVAPAAELQAAARSILSGSEYDSPEGVRGESMQEWLVDRLFRYLPDPVARLLTSGWFWFTLGLLALLLVVRLAIRTSRRRAQHFSPDARGEGRGHGGVSAAEMESAAAAAEARGQLDEAVRLQFRAGLLRLGDMGVIRYTDSMSTVAVGARVASPDFDAVARTFDRVHYGKLGADQGDVDDSRERWPRVLASARSRYG
jgi:hypothetical protein